MIYVLDGRASIIADIREAAGPVRECLAIRAREFLSTPAFLDAIPGYLLPDAASQARVNIVLERLTAISKVTSS